MRKMTLYVAAFLLISGTESQAISEQQYDVLFQMTFGYYTAARVCGNGETIQISRDSLIRVVNYGDGINIKSASVDKYNSNTEYLVKMGEEQYRKYKWVSCEQIDHYVREIDKQTRSLP
jgi:hypothetical protein